MILYCDACGKRADAGDSVMCGPCNDDRVRARAASHAAGYAEAVADIRQMVAMETDEDQEALSWVIRRLDRGAHVGASKRSGT